MSGEIFPSESSPASRFIISHRRLNTVRPLKVIFLGAGISGMLVIAII